MAYTCFRPAPTLNGYSPKLNTMSTKFFVGVLSLYFRRSMLRSPHKNIDFFYIFYILYHCFYLINESLHIGGVSLRCLFSWKSHINKISINIARTTGIIRNLNQVLPCSVLLTIYNSLILPYLNYGILAWGYDTTRIFSVFLVINEAS